MYIEDLKFSLWADFIERDYLDNEFKDLIDSKTINGATSNPAIFKNAILTSPAYKEQLATLNNIFGPFKGSVDMLDEDDISDYHFMMGMPYYEDRDELGEGTTAELLKKVQEYKKGEFVLFTLKLSDDSYLVGYDLAKETKEFVKKIGRANAAVLPYCISIANGKATSLEAKYYLAVSYPLLSMGEFTTIATVPGAIKKDLAQPFE